MYGFLSSVLLILTNSHGVHDSKEYETFEEINQRIFHKRVVSVNYTEETINGEQIQFYVTDTGDWHLDSCTVIGNNEVGLIGLYYHVTDQRRRLNPYVGNTNQNAIGSWVGGTVAYVIEHKSLNMANWNAAVEHYHAVSPIRLVDYTYASTRPKFYIRVFQGSGCYGTLGRVHEYWTTQPNYQGNSLSLGNGCDGWLPTIVHEIGHNLGFHHTQKRSDRDQYITVFYDNIQTDYWSQYEIVNDPVCGEYDCSSVMHYFDTAFGNGNGKTMVAKNPTCQIQRSSSSPLSYWDRQCLCQLYPPGSNGNPSPTCPGGVTTDEPTVTPVQTALPQPTRTPTNRPTPWPTPLPTKRPTPMPIQSVTNSPTTQPSWNPTVKPTPLPTQNSDDFCLRGRGVVGTSLFVNGNYIKQNYGDNNGNVYYKNARLSCQLSTYVYQYTRYYYNKLSDTYSQTTVWALGRELNAGSPIAICSETNVIDCDRKWTFGTNYDTNLRLTPGECPNVPCDTLRVSGTNSVCDGDYSEITANNYGKNGYYLIYNDFYEQYRCIEASNMQYINACDEYDGIKSSQLGVFPNWLNSNIAWAGQEGAFAQMACVDTTTTTPAPTPAVRQSLGCGYGNSIDGTLALNESHYFDWVADGNNYAYIWYTCHESTNFDVDLEITTQNLENRLEYGDYSNNYCSATPEKQVLLMWRSVAQYEHGVTYTIKLNSNTGGYGDYKLTMYCYTNQADALSFGKNDGEYVPIFSFKAYGTVQWTIFILCVLACIILNILLVWFLVRKIVKKKEADLESKKQINNSYDMSQANIQLANDTEAYNGHTMTNE